MFLVTLETKDAAKSALLKDLETERAKLQSLQVIVSVVMPPPARSFKPDASNSRPTL